MTTAVSDLARLLATLEPVRMPGIFAHVTLPAWHVRAPIGAIAAMRGAEGLSALLPAGVAVAQGLAPGMLCGWIALRRRSPLNASGLSASLIRALAERDIPCNVVAGTQQDDVFVPIFRVHSAMDALRALQRDAAAEAAA